MKKSPTRIIHVVGARPNFMKAAPVMRALSKKSNFEQVLVHTGQHYDDKMSDVFFQQLGIPAPDVNLGVGSATHSAQTARIMTRFEAVVSDLRPDLVLVYGDVNSTVAAALVCAKSLIPVGHVEAGLRSFDRTMPEEVNRVLTDQMSDWLFTPSGDGDANLLREGIASEKIHLVGSAMIDTLVRLLDSTSDEPLADLGLEPHHYCLVTLHRPSNVDEPGKLGGILKALEEVSRDLPVVFPVHPRTRRRMQEFGLQTLDGELRLLEPLGYLDFLGLQRKARLVITDSGGIQEETTYLGVPCLTVRENTERPVTISQGTNTLVGTDMGRLRVEIDRVLQKPGRNEHRVPPLWDGKTGERIAQILEGTT